GDVVEAAIDARVLEQGQKILGGLEPLQRLPRTQFGLKFAPRGAVRLKQERHRRRDCPKARHLGCSGADAQHSADRLAGMDAQRCRVGVAPPLDRVALCRRSEDGLYADALHFKGAVAPGDGSGEHSDP
ncbi:hypothetical protein DM456_17055, partial [Legionella pneumophila]